MKSLNGKNSSVFVIENNFLFISVLIAFPLNVGVVFKFDNTFENLVLISILGIQSIF